METREYPRILPDLDVFDADGQKVGTVGRVYERTPGAAESAAVTAIGVATSPTADGGQGVAGDGAFELRTGLFGLGTHYYVPFDAVKDVTTGGVFLTRRKAEFSDLNWSTKPDFVEHPEGTERQVAPAGARDTVQPDNRETVTATNSAPRNWEAVRSHFRMRWSEHYGAPGAQWESYEPRYRFAWEMAQLPEFQGQSWVAAQPALRNRWEVLYPDLEWETVSETVRDAWEHPVPALR